MSLDLKKIAKEINERHEEFGRLVGVTLAKAKRIGDLLIQVKAMLPLGPIEGRKFERVRLGQRQKCDVQRAYPQFMKWVQENCKFKPATASHYMQISLNYGKIEAYMKEHPDEVIYYNKAYNLTRKNPLRECHRIYIPKESAARETKEERNGVVGRTSNRDDFAAMTLASDGDLIAMLVKVLWRRDHPERIIEQVQERLMRMPKRRPSIVEELAG